MKKLNIKSILKFLSILSLSLSLLIPSTVLASQQTTHYYNMTTKATQSTYNQSDSLYHTTLTNEDSEAYTILSTDNITNQWFSCSVSDNATPQNTKDDMIIHYGLLQDSYSLKDTEITDNQIILHVNSSILDTNSNLYIDEVQTENGDVYTIESYDNISNCWLNATINEDYEITDYKIMEEN